MVTLAADDIEVLETALTWLREGKRVALVTVLRTWGSSPRPPGSLLAMSDAGAMVGSVSGGCIEETLLARFRDGELSLPGPTRIDFGVDREDAARFGLPCGGRLELLVEEPLDGETTAVLVERMRAGQLAMREVDLGNGRVRVGPPDPGVDFCLTDHKLFMSFGPAWQLLLVGDGQLARHLADMAMQLGYRVVICEPRDEFRSPEPLDGVFYTTAMPDDAVAALGHHAGRTAVVTLAHDPKQDDLALIQALDSEVFYIGALGSHRTARARLQRLGALGFAAQKLARIHAPAGLEIGSKRPAEIALSILAQVTAVRNGMTA